MIINHGLSKILMNKWWTLNQLKVKILIDVQQETLAFFRINKINNIYSKWFYGYCRQFYGYCRQFYGYCCQFYGYFRQFCGYFRQFNPFNSIQVMLLIELKTWQIKSIEETFCCCINQSLRCHNCILIMQPNQ